LNSGKIIRWKHIFREDEKAVIVAMDHSIRGYARGLENYIETVKEIAAGGADAILTSYGNLITLGKYFPRNLGIFVTMPYPPNPSFVEQASKAGADGVKYTHFGPLDSPNLHQLQPVAAECERFGLVFMAEVVPMDVDRSIDRKSPAKLIPEQVSAAARLGQEAGADVIKTAYTGDAESFRQVIANCPIPVVILGGAKTDDRSVLEAAKGAIDAGGAGICMGRNIFQHRDPTAITQALVKIVHEGASVEEAIKILK